MIKNLTLALALLCPPLAYAQDSVERPLPLDGQIAADGSQVALDWRNANRPNRLSVRIKRRIWGETGGDTWQVISPDLSRTSQFIDTTIEPQIAYEYQIQRLAQDVVDVGYWVTGVDLPIVEEAKTAYLAIDTTLSEALAPHINRLERDLIGDGWQVRRREVARGDAKDVLQNLADATALRQWLQEQHARDPMGKHAVILLGHVPIVSSGQSNPDGHNMTQQTTDLFYGDMDGQWRFVESIPALMDNQVPSDAIEMQVGRIDFSNLAEGEDELALLRAYLDKAHHWRHGLHGDLRRAYAQNNNLISESYALRNIVGPSGIAERGHTDLVGSTLWLWGVDFGKPNERDVGRQNVDRVIFALDFGSHKQKLDRSRNALNLALARPFYTVAVGWGARPAWWLHHMALGATIGDVHFRTVNNGRAGEPYRDSMDYWPTGRYLWRNPIWVNLLGDPTLRAFVLAPPVALSASATAQGVSLEWRASPDPDLTGYRIYKSVDNGPMTLLADNIAAAATEFTDPDQTDSAQYMLRASGLKSVYAGSFNTLSQGVFATTGHSPEPAPAIEITTPRGTPVALPAEFQAPVDGTISAVIAKPQTGSLILDGAIWTYTPPIGFTGPVTLPYARSGTEQTMQGTLTVQVE